MTDVAGDLSSLTKFTIAIGAAVLLPKLMERLRLPGVLGFIVAGILVGPNGFGLLNPEGSTITLLAELWKLLFMFFVGFEIDLDEFKKVSMRSSFSWS